MKSGLKIDKTDLLSLPLFAITIYAERRALQRATVRREPGDLDDWTPEALSDPRSPADPLVPVGYERRDTIASLTMLAGNVAIGFATAGILGKAVDGVFRRRLFTITGRRGSFAAAMVAWDFLYYWSHRWQHEKRIFWANHVAHHSSEHYNLSTALRQPWAGFVMSWVYLPMPLLGFSARQTAKAGQLNLLYQYWIHTETIDRLAPSAEAVLNTPSHHRAHHGANPQYLDKNYGGILITWDRLFGTFEPEVRRVKYGLTKNIETFSPVRIGYGEFANLVRDVRAAESWRTRWGHVWRRPGWQPADGTDLGAAVRRDGRTPLGSQSGARSAAAGL